MMELLTISFRGFQNLLFGSHPRPARALSGQEKQVADTDNETWTREQTTGDLAVEALLYLEMPI